MPDRIVSPNNYHPLDEELGRLWSRRHAMTPREWQRLHDVVFEILSPVNYTHYGSLPGYSRRDLIAAYFRDRVFLPVTTTRNPCSTVHAGALRRIYYPHYLLDLIRSHKRKREDLGWEEDIGGTESGTETDELDLATTESRVLKQDGYSVEQVAWSATAFLAGNPDWVLIYLGRHHCPEDEDRVPLSTVAREQGIRNYHAKALELGITCERGGFQNYDDFAATRLGRWFEGLGIAIRMENVDLIEAALKILCWVALTKVRELGFA